MSDNLLSPQCRDILLFLNCTIALMELSRNLFKTSRFLGPGFILLFFATPRKVCCSSITFDHFTI